MTRHKLATALLLSCALMTTTAARADISPEPGLADARVKTIPYHNDDVYKIKGHYGYSTIIEFPSKERIETTNIGDSDAWQVIKPPNHPYLLIIKPLVPNADTNMTVLAGQHIYSFMLHAEKAASPDDPDLIFRLRFTYPDDPGAGLVNYSTKEEAKNEMESAPPPLAAKNLNFNYSFKGDKALEPERVFDDGKFTYFQFKGLQSTPAVFVVDEKGNESLVNFTAQGDYMVVERLSGQFTLRDGDIQTCIFNDSYSRPSGKEHNKTALGKIKPKKTAKKNIGQPDPPFLSWFKRITPNDQTALNP